MQWTLACLAGVCVTVLQSLPPNVSWWLIIPDLVPRPFPTAGLSFINLINLLCSLCFQENSFLCQRCQLPYKLYMSNLQKLDFYFWSLSVWLLVVQVLSCFYYTLFHHHTVFVMRGYHRQIFGLLSLLIVHNVIREFISWCAQTADSPNIRWQAANSQPCTGGKPAGAVLMTWDYR